MDENKEPIVSEPEETAPYAPRPKWQVALAWVLLVLMIIGVAGYYYWIAYRY